MKKNIYFRTTHAASTSILVALEELGMHSSDFSAHQIQPSGLCVVRPNRSGDDQFHAHEWETEWGLDAYKWTVVRNPWARTVSAWRSLRRWAWSKRHSFEDFVEFLHTAMWTRHNPDYPSQEELAGAMEQFAKVYLPHVCDCEVPGLKATYLNTPKSHLAESACGCYYAIEAHAFPMYGSFFTEICRRDEGVLSPMSADDFKDFKNDVGEFSFRWRKIDRYIRFEHLQNDFNELCTDLGLPQTELKHTNGKKFRDSSKGNLDAHMEDGVWKFEEKLNKDGIAPSAAGLKSTSNADYTNFYTPRSTRLIKNLFAYEITKFGYEFGD